MSLSNTDISGFNKILLPFPDSSLTSHYVPIYFTNASKKPPSFQYKYYRMKGLHIPDEFLGDSLLESLLPHSVFIEATQERDFFPVVRLMSQSEFEETFEFYSKNPNLNNFYYFMATYYEKKLDYFRAKDFLDRGCEHFECFSLLKMARILAEPLLAEKYQIKQDLSQVLSLLLTNFIHNGLFDCFTPNNESFHGIYLLYLYLDCFPQLNSLARKSSLKNPLLKLLLMPDWRNPNTYSLLQELENDFKDCNILLGDLYHPRILGVNIETEFNKMQEHFAQALRTQKKGWLKVACLNESFLAHELNRQAKLKGPNQMLEDSIKKINRNIETAYKRLESFPEYLCSFELLHFQASNSNKKSLELGQLENYRKLAKCGDETVLRVFFKILKFHYKKTENSSQRQEIANELFLIACKIAYTEHEFKEAPLAFCFEKGLGTNRNFAAAFNLYRDLLKKIISSGFEIHFFCYRLASLLKSELGFEDTANFFFQVSYWGLMSSINEDDFNGFYELGKFYIKGRGIEQNEAYAIKIYENLLRNIKDKKRESMNDQILIQLLARKIAKFKKSGPSAIKNSSENESLRDLIQSERKSSNKIIKNWAIYKTLSLGSSLSTEILSALSNLNEKVKSMSPNIEEIQSKIFLPYAKPQITILGSLKPKEVIKDPLEVPRWKPAMRLSFKMKREQLEQAIKDTLGKVLHAFDPKDLNINFEEPKHCGAHELFPALLKFNSQVFSLKVIELDPSDKTNLAFIEKIELYAGFSSPYWLNIVGFSIDPEASESDPNKIRLFLLYETFTDSLADFLENHESDLALNEKYFLWLLFIVQTFQNSGFLLNYLSENNFVVAKTLIPKLVDFDFEVFNKAGKQTVGIDASKSESIAKLAQQSVPPEVLYGFLKGIKATLSLGSVVWSLGTIGFWVFTHRKLFEGPEISKYEEFKNFYNQEKIFARIDSSLESEPQRILIKSLLNMNQQERTNLTLPLLWLNQPNAEVLKEFPSENHLIIHGFLHSNFLENNPHDRETYLGKKEYFRGDCLGNLPSGTCKFTSGNLSLRADFSKGKLVGMGELFNQTNLSVIEMKAFDPNTGLSDAILKKLAFFDTEEVSLRISTLGMNIDEAIFEKMTSGFMANEKSTLNNDLDEQVKWENIIKFQMSFRNFNRNTAQKILLLDNTLILWNVGQNNEIIEFLLIKSHYANPYYLVFDEKISTKNVFFCSFFSFGVFQLTAKPAFKSLANSQFCNLNGVKFTFPGVKENGVFNDFELQKGTRITDYQVMETVDFTKKVLFSKITDNKLKEKYEGLSRKQQKHYFGQELHSTQSKYEGGFEENRISGKGVFYDPEGKIFYKGYFLEGVPTWGVFYREKTRKYEGIFRQTDNFYGEFKLRSSEDLLENFAVLGNYHTPEEKVILTTGLFNLKDPSEDLTGRFRLIYDTLNEYNGFLENSIKKGLGSYLIKKDGVPIIEIKGFWDAKNVRAVIHWDSANAVEQSVGNFSITESGNYIMADFGLLHFKKGDKYEGSLQKNKLEGYGEFQQDVNGLRKKYMGEFINSLRNGFGKLEDLLLSSGEKTIYEGFFSKNKKSGFGVLTSRQAPLIQGLFADNSVQFGWLFIKDHPIIEKICGNLGKKDQAYAGRGFGIVHLKNGMSLECEISRILTDYEGEFVGKIKFKNEKKAYQGMIKRLKPNGRGELYKNGIIVYSGEFKDGKFHGFGRLRIGKELEIIGEFRNGLKEGFGVEFDLKEKKVVFKGYWENGVKKQGRIVRKQENGPRMMRVKSHGTNQIILDL